MLKKTLLLAFAVAITFATGCVPDNYAFDRETCKTGSGKGEILSATDMELNRDGNIVIADAGNSRFQVLKTDGTFLLSGGDNARKGYKLSSVSGIGVNPITDDIWVCDQKGNKVVRFSPEGEPLLKLTDKVKYPMDVTIDRNGNAFVIMTKKPEIYKYDSSGNFIEKIGGSGKSALLFPTSILFADNHLYVTDFGGARVLKMTTKGELVSEFKSKGEYEDMLGPSSIHVDKDGNLYILDLGEVPVVVLKANGELISKIGSFGNEKGKFLYPRGILALPNEEILVLDNSRNCILTFKRKPENK